MRQMRHIADTKNAFSATTSVPSVPFPDTISAHAVVPNGPKAGHQGPLTFSACPSTLSLLRWNHPSSTPQLYAPALRPSSTIGRGDMRLPHRRAMGDLLRKDERRKGATSQIELNPLRSPAIAQISLKSATKKRAADTSSLQSMKSSYAAYEAHGGAKPVGPAP